MNNECALVNLVEPCMDTRLMNVQTYECLVKKMSLSGGVLVRGIYQVCPPVYLCACEYVTLDIFPYK